MSFNAARPEREKGITAVISRIAKGCARKGTSAMRGVVRWPPNAPIDLAFRVMELQIST